MTAESSPLVIMTQANPGKMFQDNKTVYSSHRASLACQSLSFIQRLNDIIHIDLWFTLRHARVAARAL